MSGQVKTKRNWKILHLAMTAIIIFGFGYIPPLEPITEEGMIILGVFLGCVYGWSTVDMIWPSLLGILRLGVAKGMSTVLAAGLGAPAVWMAVMFFVVIGIMNDNGLIGYIATRFLSFKVVQGRPWLLIFFMTLGVYVVSFFNAPAALLIFWNILFKICEMFKIPPYSKFPVVSALILLVASIISLIGIPFTNNGIVAMATYNQISGTEIDILRYIITSIPIGIFAMIASVLIGKYILRVPIETLKNIDLKEIGITDTKMTMKQKCIMFMFFWMVIDLLLPSILPNGILKSAMTSLTLFGQVALPVAVFSCVTIDGEPLFSLRDGLKNYISWDIVFLLSMVFPLISVMTAESTGVTLFLNNLVAPLASLGPVGFLVILTAVVAILTNVANNAILFIIALPVVYSFAMQNGINPIACMFILLYATHFAFLTPAACPNAALYYSYSNWVDMKSTIKQGGIVLFVTLWISTMLFGYFWAMLIW